MSIPGPGGPPQPPEATGYPLNHPAWAPPPAPAASTVTIADGEWHRLHPLTPLFKGALGLVIFVGILLGGLRDRLIYGFIALFTPEDVPVEAMSEGDPLELLLRNNLLGIATAVMVGVVMLLVALFYFAWRFHEFRVTGETVEVRRGILFRQQRRAPLDRVQGVNLVRPFPARLVGLVKLEVVGAGTDANVPLEYLATAKAEAVRRTILGLASGARERRAAAAAGVGNAPGVLGAPDAAGVAPQEQSRADRVLGLVGDEVSGLVGGVDLADVAPESLVRIPIGRLIAAHLLAAATMLIGLILFLAVLLGGITIGVIFDDEDGGVPVLMASLAGGIPLFLVISAVTIRRVLRDLRYSIAETRDGLRITFGLLTTVTEVIPPGRIFAISITQPLFWRPFGWWAIRINRMNGASAQSQAQQQGGTNELFATLLPVGTLADVDRVLALAAPDLSEAERAALVALASRGPAAEGFRGIPRRVRWRHPISWRFRGFGLLPDALLLRRGRLGRTLSVIPFARMQSIAVTQGPVGRAQRVGTLHIHSVTGHVPMTLGAIDRDDLMALMDHCADAAAGAAARDRSHRWREGDVGAS